MTISAFWPMPHLDGTDSEIAERLGVSRRTVIRWRQRGIPTHLCDGVAERLGEHPEVLWPGFTDFHVERYEARLAYNRRWYRERRVVTS